MNLTNNHKTNNLAEVKGREGEGLDRRSRSPALKISVDNKLIAKHYIFSAIVFAVYGVGVCPFIESLNYYQLLLPIFFIFAFIFTCRMFIWKYESNNKPIANKVRRVFVSDLILFGVLGLVLAIYNLVVYDFPAESGGKVIVGMLFLGWYVSINLALHNELSIGIALKKSGIQMRRTEDFHPLTRKFSNFTLASLSITAVVLLLVVRKDIHWLAEKAAVQSIDELLLIVVLEFMFVLGVMLVYMQVTIKSYAKNSAFFLGNQNEALKSVSKGDFSAVVPVASNDEFGEMAQLTNEMIHKLSSQAEEIHHTRDTTILALSSLAETRDNETGAHILRTQRYVKALCIKLQQSEKYKNYLTDETIELMYKSAPLHDIGKVGIPDSILLKPGRHTEEEFEIMKTHATLGKESLEVAERELGGNSFLSLAKEIAASHHEKWDGSGYPLGLSGEDIPISGRLMALADVYDALISKRVYKSAFSHEKACSIITEGRGRHFDPEVVDAFFEIEQQFIEIAKSFKDTE